MKHRNATIPMLGMVALASMMYLAGAGAVTSNIAAVTGINATVTGQQGVRAAAVVTAAVAGATPIAADDAYSVAPGTTLRVNVLDNDTDAVTAKPDVAWMWTGPGSPTLLRSGTLIYTAPLGATGSYTFRYVAINALLTSNSSAVVTITIETPGSGPITPSAAAPALDGAALYASAGCAACHGPGGSGGWAADLGNTTNAVFVAKMSANGTMASYTGSLSAAKIQAIADYFDPPAATPPAATPPATTPPAATPPAATPPAATPPAAPPPVPPGP